MKNSIMTGCVLAASFSLGFLFAASAVRAQVKPGDIIGAKNAAAVQKLVSPGTYAAVTRGMEMHIIAPGRIDWPPPYRIATEKYSPQVRLSADHRTLVGYVAGQPFPLLDPNDPDIATKIMWNSDFRPITTDDFDLRYFECQVAPFNPGGEQQLMKLTETGHFAGYFNIGRTEVEPLPADPDFKVTGIWWRAAAYPTLAPADDRGSGGIRYRYWDPERGDDAWAYLAGERRVRRVNEVILSASPGLSTWDPDHAGGFAAKPQEYNYKFLGERNMLACAHAAHSPEQPCPTDGRATACPEDWEMRHLYVVEVTPRPERISGVLQSKTIVYVDGESWFNPYVDSYDRKGELWKAQIYLLTYRDRPVPDARVAVYPYKREFVLAASSIDTQTGIVTTCYLPGPDTPERECWYINMGAVDKGFFSTESLIKAGH
jgi:Protein of unknown function (DUF1329)